MGKNSELLKHSPNISVYTPSNFNTVLCAFLFKEGFAEGERNSADLHYYINKGCSISVLLKNQPSWLSSCFLII